MGSFRYIYRMKFACMKFKVASKLGPMLVLLTFISCLTDDIDALREEKKFAELENYRKFKSDYLFDDNKLPTFELTLSESSLAFLDADPGAEEYVEGNLTFEGETLENVGIRYKGSLGAFVDCVSGGIENGPKGRKICRKLSMKVKINQEDPDRKFFGLKKLVFHSENNDNTKMNERLGYYLFRSMGVPASRSIHARLVINGEYNGLYSFTEQIDGRFTRHNFEEGNNNLYKEVWPIDSKGRQQPDQLFLNSLKTNRNEHPSIALMASFSKELGEAENEEKLLEVIQNRMDIDKILTLIAVDRVIRNDDGAFHWYCGEVDCGNHNYYWYEEPSRGKLHLIPWDLDSAFENIDGVVNPFLYIADTWPDTQNDCKPYIFGPAYYQRSAACDKLQGGWALFEAAYAQKKAAFINGPFSAVEVNQLLDKWVEQIRGAVAEADDLFDDNYALSVEGWEQEVTELKSRLAVARFN